MLSEFKRPLISVIIAAYNAELYIKDAVGSVIGQTYSNLEIIVVDDGSTDSTGSLTQAMEDPRIQYIKQENKGVSAARNAGIEASRGDFFCFLDADDLMPAQSVKVRYDVFLQHPDLEFVGGAQEQWDSTLSKRLKIQLPSYWGSPRQGLLNLDPSCFINCGTWLIKRNRARKYAFPAGWTHCEDLAFFLSISDQGELGYTQETVQYYRRSASSAMGNLTGLAQGYIRYYNFISKDYNVPFLQKLKIKLKLTKIIFASFLAQRRLVESFVYSLKMIGC